MLRFLSSVATRTLAADPVPSRSKKTLPVSLEQRAVVPNDTKLFAQADVVPGITHYLTADRECEKVYNLLMLVRMPRFQFVHLSTPWHRTFGELDLPA